MMTQTSQDLELLRDIPGYKAILKALIKSQIQHLVEQLASHGEEEAVLLTASITDGSLSHLGSESGKVFLDTNEDIKSKFLGFCLKRHHKAQTSETESVYQSPPVPHPQPAVLHRRPRTASHSPRNHFTPNTSPYSLPKKHQRQTKFKGSIVPNSSNFDISTPVSLSGPNIIMPNVEGQGEMLQSHGQDNSETGGMMTVKVEKVEQNEDNSIFQGDATEQEHSSELLPQTENLKNSVSDASQEDSTLSNIKIEAVTEEDLELEITGVEMSNSAEAGQMGASADWSMSDNQGANQSFDNKLKNRKATLKAFEEDIDWCTLEQETKRREAKQHVNTSFERGAGSEIESYVKIEMPVEEKVSQHKNESLEAGEDSDVELCGKIDSPNEEKVLMSDIDRVEQETKREAKQHENTSFGRGGGSEIESWGKIDLPVEEKVSKSDIDTLEQETKSDPKQHKNESLEAGEDNDVELYEHIESPNEEEVLGSDVDTESLMEDDNSLIDADYVLELASHSDSSSECSVQYPYLLVTNPGEPEYFTKAVSLLDENSGQNINQSDLEESTECHAPKDLEENTETCAPMDLEEGTFVEESTKSHASRRKPIPECERLYSGTTKIYIKRHTKINKNSSIGRSFDCVHACYYCKALYTNIQIHLEHHTEKLEVKEINNLKKKALFVTEAEKLKVKDDIKRLQNLLRNKGDNWHNQSVTKNQDGELLIARRTQGYFNHREYGSCPECHEWIRLEENYRKHMKSCPCKEHSPDYVKLVQQLIFEKKVSGTASKYLKEEVFPSMMRGHITETAMADPLIVSLGEFHFLSNFSNKMRRKNYTSYRMRLAARLLHLVRSVLENPTASYIKLLVVENFDVFVKSSLDACGINEDEQLKHPSTAIKLGHDLARLAAAKGTFAIKRRDEDQRKEASDFAFLIEREWKIKVKKRAVTLLQERQFNKFVQFPIPEDVAKLAEYLIKSLNEVELTPDPLIFNRVVVLTEARLLLYNRRRPLEIEALDIGTYKRRSTGLNETDLSLRAELTKLEKVLLESQELLELRGKGNQRVPLILPQEVKKPLQYLTNSIVRMKSGVKKTNSLVFANTGDMAVRPGDALNIVKHEIPLKQPRRITATNLRKHTATISQVMGLEDQQLEWLVNHMGHTEKVHLQNYRATSGLIERLNVAKIMLVQEKEAYGRFAGMKLCDIQFEDITDNDGPVDVDGGPASAESVMDGGDSEAASTSVAGNAVSDSDDAEYEKKTRKVRKKRTGAVKRIPWTKKEVNEINKYLKHFFTLQSKRKCPGMQDCMLAISRSKAAGGELWKRSWETIKKKVSNMMKMKSRTMNSE